MSLSPSAHGEPHLRQRRRVGRPVREIEFVQQRAVQSDHLQLVASEVQFPRGFQLDVLAAVSQVGDAGFATIRSGEGPAVRRVVVADDAG